MRYVAVSTQDSSPFAYMFMAGVKIRRRKKFTGYRFIQMNQVSQKNANADRDLLQMPKLPVKKRTVLNW